MNEYQSIQLKAKAAELAAALLNRKVGFLEVVHGTVALSAEFGDAERFESPLYRSGFGNRSLVPVHRAGAGYMAGAPCRVPVNAH
jgi:hypothetical protein